MSVCVIACQRADTGFGNPAGAATIASPAIVYAAPSEALKAGHHRPSCGMPLAQPQSVRGTRLHGVAVQKLTSHDPQSEREQMHLLSNSGCITSLFPVAASDPPVTSRCSCGSPAVMWECEYFCSTTGDLCSKCSRAVA